MKTLILVLLLACGTGIALARVPEGSTPVVGDRGISEPAMRRVIQRHLGRPYVRGASGLRNFDCSGFVWRVLKENGFRVKRTSARKLYLRLPRLRPDESPRFGTLVFFNRLRHMGIVNDSGSFYHASSSVGTTLSDFDPYWRSRIHGYRTLPAARDR